MDYKDLANLIFPDAKEISYYEEKYPERNLPEGAVVTRFAPSPTGFVHIGGLYQALVARTVAEKTGGVFFLRVEDTDQKREVENGVTGIVNSLKDFDMAPDEGMISDTEEIGNYGPYKQSLRKEIYQAYAKYLLEQGKAYPCFCTPDDLEEIRNKQEAAKLRTGYYGVWAKCRNLTVEESAEKIKNGEPYIIRFKSPGREDRKIKHKDVIKGKYNYGCIGYKDGCNFKISTMICKKIINKNVASEILKNKISPVIEGFISKNNKEFKARLKLEDDGKLSFVFD